MARFAVALGLAVALIAAGCSADQADDGRISVVVTTTILGDVVGNVVGSDADVEVLMPIGATPHGFVPSARQVAKIYAADLVVANGLGLEAGLADVLEAARGDGVNVLEVAPQLDPLPFGDGDDLDPHVWMDPVRMMETARLIATELTAVAPSVDWDGNAETYVSELQSTHDTIRQLLAAIPTDQRKLVTNHDSLGYFADRYDFAVIGTVIPGGSSLGNPSSADLAELVAVIEREQSPAIFAESIEPKALADAVAAELGADVAVVELFTGSLGEPGTVADALIGMLLVDAERIANALGS
ncbi:MAG: zinc ABC transporter substrate-binding protein AztC [Acidimicrobiia bacterium]|nr:MAG: zinc ABC transporter substrate-binding protein AztC [Acidimicrobiia bacterium]